MNLTKLQRRALRQLSKKVPVGSRASVSTQRNADLLSLRRMRGLARLGLVSFTQDGVRPTRRGREAV